MEEKVVYLPGQKDQREVATVLREIADRVQEGHASVFVVAMERWEDGRYRHKCDMLLQPAHNIASMYAAVRYRLKKLWRWVFEEMED